MAWQGNRVVEDTFIFNHINDMVDVLFGESDVLSYEW